MPRPAAVFLAPLALLGVLLPAATTLAATDQDARALGGACYWQSRDGLSESALEFRDRIQAILGIDLFSECEVREQTWGVTVVECATSEQAPWTLTLRVGFPGGLDRWQACITKIESGARVVYSANFFVRYRAQIAAAALLYTLYALVRALRQRRSG